MSDVNLGISGSDEGATALLRELLKQMKGVNRESDAMNSTTGRSLNLFSRVRNQLGAIITTYLGFRTAVGTFQRVIRVTQEAEQANARLQGVLRATGNASGRTAGQIEAMANALSRTTLFDDEAIKNAAATLATFRNVQNQTFDDALKRILAISQALGRDLGAVALQVGRALDEPGEAVQALSAAGIRFTKNERDMLAAMVEVNDIAGAQKIIIDRLTASFGENATGAEALSGSIHAVTLNYDNFLESLAQSDQFSTPVQNLLKMLANFFKVRELATTEEEANLNLLFDLETKLTQLQARRIQLVAFGSSNVVLDALDQETEEVREMIRTTMLANETLKDRGKIAEANATKSAANAKAEADRERTRLAQEAAAKKASEAAARETERLLEEQARARERAAEEAIELAERDLDTILKIHVELTRESGRLAEAERLELESEYAAMIRRLEAVGDTAGVALVRKLINVKVAKVELGLLETSIGNTQQRLANRLVDIEARFNAGLLTPRQRAEEMAAAYRETVEVLERAADALVVFNLIANNPTLVDSIEKLRNEVRRLKGELADVSNEMNRLGREANVTFERDLKSAFAGLLTTTDRIDNAFVEMARSIVTSLQRIAAEIIATRIVAQLLEGLPGGGLFPVAAARGGLIRGPGSGTSDSISARLSAGEYVVRASAVQEYGVDFLDALNGLRLSPVARRGVPGFAAGGLVPSRGDTVHSSMHNTFTSLDPRSHAELLRQQMPTLGRLGMQLARFSRAYDRGTRR